MKKGLVFLVLAILIAGVVFAQEKSASVKDNWISGEVSLIGAGARYERMLNPKLSLGASAYYCSVFIVSNDIAVDVNARFYPWGKTFFAGLAVGFHNWTILSLSTGASDISMTGAAITPELGWKIDVGQPGAWFIAPGARLPIILGVWSGDTEDDGKFGVQGGMPQVYFGIGYAF